MGATMGRISKQVRVTGRVQGVAFRAWTREQALGLGLDGWVRNERDGSVAALVSGDEAQVMRMLSALRKGPLAASVEDIVVEDADAPAETGFAVVR